MVSNSEIIRKASEYVFTLFKENKSDCSVYHNYNHTIETVAACEEIGDESNLSKSEQEIVAVAAWFHDTGYTEDCENHEEKSVEIATRFLQQNNYPQEKIAQVASCIRATKVPQDPKNLLEEVICDADILHFGKKKFFQKSDLMRMELERRADRPFSDLEWLQKSVDFVTQHNFHTRYAQLDFNKQRTKNLIKLQELLREAQSDHEETLSDRKLKEEKFTGKLEKEKIPVRGIETMFRLTSGNHIDLSSIADHKANMMISSNSLILTLVVTLFGRDIISNTNSILIIPILILLIVCVTTIIFAILATRPKITEGIFTKEDIEQKRANLLFFGNFYNMRLEDYEWGVKEMMNDREYLYGNMIRDIYFLGKVLARKYRYLRICYNVFMYGLIVAVIAFAVAFLIR
ncbi:MAG: HD domain-containing protein [Ignavibacteriae bacterium]|nr:HD domain-containing protein [Ignavibacteriota bacterium]